MEFVFIAFIQEFTVGEKSLKQTKQIYPCCLKLTYEVFHEYQLLLCHTCDHAWCLPNVSSTFGKSLEPK